MERVATRSINGAFQSWYRLPLAAQAAILAMLTIVAISSSGCSSSRSDSDDDNQSAQRAGPSAPLAARPARVATPTDLEPMRLAVYQFQPSRLPVVSEAKTQNTERPIRLPFVAGPSYRDRPVLAGPELDGPRFNNAQASDTEDSHAEVNHAEGYRPTIDAPPLTDHGFAPRYDANANADEDQVPAGELEPAEFAPQQTLPSAHISPSGPGMEIVSRRADVYVRKGYELAGRGALYSARAQFVLALRTIADALDAQSGSDHHGAALDAGLTALRESDDFRSPAAAIGSRRPLAVIVSSHHTPILKYLPAHGSAPGRVAAMQRYYTYAQQQLAVAGGRERTASRALYGLGKTSLAMQHARDPAIIAGGPRAIVFHQAALLVDSRNYMAANELGVMLAHCGQYQAARQTLRHAAANSNDASVWKNLSRIHEYLGERSLAMQARRQVEIVQLEKRRRQGSATAGDLSGSPQQPIVWLDSSAFAATSKFEADARPVPAKPNSKSRPSPQPKAPQAAQRRTPSLWFPSFGGTRR